jgi:hypothetical protein
LTIRLENATLTSQQPSDELTEKKEVVLPNHIAPLEKLLTADVKQRTVIAVDSHRPCVDFIVDMPIRYTHCEYRSANPKCSMRRKV